MDEGGGEVVKVVDIDGVGLEFFEELVKDFIDCVVDISIASVACIGKIYQIDFDFWAERIVFFSQVIIGE